MLISLSLLCTTCLCLTPGPARALTLLLPPPPLQVDPFHTLFGVAGLSLLGDEQIKDVNPVLCMPEDVLERLGLQPDLLS